MKCLAHKAQMKISGPSKQLLVAIYLSICINLGYLHTVVYFISSEGITLTASDGQSRYIQLQSPLQLTQTKMKGLQLSPISHPAQPCPDRCSAEDCVDAPWENKKFLRMLFTNAQCYTVSMYHGTTVHQCIAAQCSGNLMMSLQLQYLCCVELCVCVFSINF